MREGRRQKDVDLDAEAMALIERRTGVRLDADWVDGFDQAGQIMLIGDIPDDPKPQPSRRTSA